jgi:hypothetical protein
MVKQQLPLELPLREACGFVEAMSGYFAEDKPSRTRLLKQFFRDARLWLPKEFDFSEGASLL